MTIRDYFEALYMATSTDKEFEAVSEMEYQIYTMCDSVEEKDKDAFARWIEETGVDITSEVGRKALQYWLVDSLLFL